MLFSSQIYSLLSPFNSLLPLKIRVKVLRGGVFFKTFLILKDKKILYTVVPKAANSTIKKHLWAEGGIDLSVNEAFNKVHDYRQTAFSVESLSDQELNKALFAQDWFRFSFVRNPYTRIVSAYTDKILNLGEKTNGIFFKKQLFTADEKITFELFIKRICAQNKHAMDWHWMPQSQLLMMSMIQYDFIGKIEELHDGLEKVYELCNLNKNTTLDFGDVQINKTTKNKTEILKKISEDQLPIFSSKLADLVYERYQEDFENFDYDKLSYKTK